MLQDQAMLLSTFPSLNLNTPEVLPWKPDGGNKCPRLDKLQADAVMAVQLAAAPGMKGVGSPVR